MPKYVHVIAHLGLDELEQQYRKAGDPVERSHFQIIWLLAQGKCVREVVEVTGYCANWIRIVAKITRDMLQRGGGTIGFTKRIRVEKRSFLINQAGL